MNIEINQNQTITTQDIADNYYNTEYGNYTIVKASDLLDIKLERLILTGNGASFSDKKVSVSNQIKINTENNTTASYQAVSAVYHKGSSTGGGHYVVYIYEGERNGKHLWRCHNDSSVSKKLTELPKDNKRRRLKSIYYERIILP